MSENEAFVLGKLQAHRCSGIRCTPSTGFEEPIFSLQNCPSKILALKRISYIRLGEKLRSLPSLQAELRGGVRQSSTIRFLVGMI